MPDFVEVPAWITLAVSIAYTLWRKTPFLSQRWRIVQTGGGRDGSAASIVVWLVKRFRTGSLDYTYAGAENRVKVGTVRLDDDAFDERIVELRFKAEETRRRLGAIR